MDPSHVQGGGRHEGVGVTFLEETFSALPPLPSIAFTRKPPRRC